MTRQLLSALCVALLASVDAQYTGHGLPYHANARRKTSSTGASSSVSNILDRAIQALGGKDALQDMKSVSSQASIYRTFSLAESYTPGISNTAIASKGHQTVYYDLSDSSVVLQRTDRENVLGDYWTFYRPNLEGVNSSLVVRSGSNGSACYNAGNNFLFAPYDVPSGYTDGPYANILVRDAWRLSPGLLLSMQASASALSAFNANVNDVVMPAIHDSSKNISVIFHPQSYLPARIRAYEDHLILGPSISDMVVYNYTETSGIKFPTNMKLLYNENVMLQEMLYDSFTVNPTLSPGFFSSLPVSAMNSTLFGIPPTPPQASTLYGAAEVFENTQNMFWAGGYTGSLSALKVIKPMATLNNLYHLTFEGDIVYKTIVAVFDDALMVTDAPPHQSLLVIQWVLQTFNRSVTHLLVTHHHHDHNYGAHDYVAQGAKLVVPEDYTFYWDKIPNVQFETSSEAQPFIYKDSKMQVRGIWHESNAHSADWQYFTFTEACPGADSPMGVVTADAWSPGDHPWDYSQQEVLEWLAIARADKVPRAYMNMGIHGYPQNATYLYPEIGYEYPDYKTSDFLPGGAWC